MSKIELNWKQVVKIAREIDTITQKMQQTRDQISVAIDGIQESTRGEVFAALTAKRDRVVMNLNELVVETTALTTRLSDDAEFVRHAVEQFDQGGKP